MNKEIILRFDINNKPMGFKGQHEQLEKFIIDNFGECNKPDVIYDKRNRVVHLDVFWFKPTKERDYHTLVTAGLSYLPMKYHGESKMYFRELIMCLPAEWNVAGKTEQEHWPLATIYNLVQFPHLHNTVIDYGHTVSFTGFSESFKTVNTRYSGECTIMGKPQLYPEDLVCKINNAIEIKFLSIIPISQSELNMFWTKFNSRSTIGKACELLKRNGITEIYNPNRQEIKFD